MGVADPRVALWLLACPVVFAANTPDGFNLSEVTPGIFVHTGRALPLNVPGHDDIANIGFIVGAKCAAVIDTGGSMRIGRELLAEIRKHTQLPICYVINTHVHVDHVLGNAAFKNDMPSFVGSAALAGAMDRSRDFFATQYAGDMDSPPSAEQVIGPDRLVDHELTLDLGGRQLLLHAWPKAHTDCDLTVYDAPSGTLWTGDLLFRERLPALDGSLPGWLAVLDDLAKMHVKIAVPGHGPVTRDLKSAIVPERRYLQALADGVRADLTEAKPLEEAIEQVAAAEKSHWLLWDNVHPRNVVHAFEELEWE
jgi:quinoprotein relay system zinc metallohydrolase 2